MRLIASDTENAVTVEHSCFQDCQLYWSPAEEISDPLARQATRRVYDTATPSTPHYSSLSYSTSSPCHTSMFKLFSVDVELCPNPVLQTLPHIHQLMVESQVFRRGQAHQLRGIRKRLLEVSFYGPRVQPFVQSFGQIPFQSRVGCILRDVKIMSHAPLAWHLNILNLLGYGWQSTGLNILPFVVTEYAPLGTLREYLLKGNTTARLRKRLCHQIPSGFHALHLSGVAHGDLKLENVLVTTVDGNLEKKPGVLVVAKLVRLRHILLVKFCMS